ncbi:UNVERIFIED_CONTAM: hypothetical protein NCL1_11628 [Trichonephila clavipes]
MAGSAPPRGNGAEATGGGPAVPSRRHHLRGLRRRGRRRAPDPLRRHSPHDSRLRVGGAGARPAPARHGAEHVPARHLPRAEHPQGRLDSARGHPRQCRLPGRHAGGHAAQPHLCPDRRHRPGTAP